MTKNPKQLLFHWIKERYLIRLRKDAGKNKPWTEDPILQQYRFCNVHREYDTVTKWIAENWRQPNAHDPDLWFAMCVARFINWPDTLEEIGYPVPFDQAQVYDTICQRSARRSTKVWTGAYVVSTNGVKATKPDYIINNLLGTVWSHRNNLRPRPGLSLADYANRLKLENGFKGFMTGQVIADLKYTEPLRSAKDWSTWAVSGPGSRRGLNRILGRDLKASWREWEWREELEMLHHEVQQHFSPHWPELAEMHAQDLQNCLCEVDKYIRVLNNEGKPRSKYRGTTT